MQVSEALLIGMPKEEIDTPALVIDLDIMEANIAKMASYFAGRKSNIRPHFKTHKCPNIAHKQLQAGAAGITCAKVEEAEALVNGGVLRNILIANQIVAKPKIAKLMGLNRHAEVMVCVDDPQNVADLSDAAQVFGVELGVLVEVNVGMNRCGVDTATEALELAKKVERAKGLKFMGLQGYEGHVVMVPDFDERKAAVHRDMQRLLDAREMIEKAGLRVSVVDGAGTGTYNITGEIPGVDEIQAGSYLFVDANYLKVLKDFQPSLTVLTTVMRRPYNGRAVTDSGMKAVSNDQAMPQPLDLEGVKVKRLAEEHALLELENPRRDLKLGDKIDLIPGHVCTTVNLHDRYYGVRNGKVEVIWPVTGRGKFR